LILHIVIFLKVFLNFST